MLRVVVVLLIVILIPVIPATNHGGMGVRIDGYTVNETFGNHEANLPLGTTLVLVCRVWGFLEDANFNFTWMCPDDPCIKKRYVGKSIINGEKKSFLTINITSVHDSGNYTCNVSSEGDTFSMDFHLKDTGGEVVHSYGRLILHEGVISYRRQLQPPTKNASRQAKGDGKIECSVRNGSRKAWFTYYGLNDTLKKVEQTADPSGFDTTVDIKRKHLNPNKFAIEGKCGSIFHYLFLNEDADCVNLDNYLNITSDSSITVTIKELPCSIARAIVGYTRLVEEKVWVEGEYVNLRECESKTFSSLIPGNLYRITAWGLSGGNTNNRRRCQSPTVEHRNTTYARASPPRDMQIRMNGDEDEIEMHWTRPIHPNGHISHYEIIKYMQNGTKQEFNTTSNYHTLTGMEKGHTYNFSLMAVHEGGLEGESVMKKYVHPPSANK